MSIYVKAPDLVFPLAKDVYKVQKRPGHCQIVVNNGYQGIKVIDPWSGTEVIEVSFTANYADSRVISEWCFRADGEAILLLNEENRKACWLALDSSGKLYDLDCPPFKIITDLRYIWEDDLFWITSGKSYKFFQLQWQDGLPMFVESSGIKARIAHRAWRQALDRLPVEGCNVLRVEPDKSQMLYHHFSASPGQVGVVSWSDETIWSAPAPLEVPRLAFHKAQMFILYEYEVHAINEQGQIEVVYPVPEGFHYSGLDTIPAQDDQSAALVLVCSSLSTPSLNQVLVYRLDS
jgi:hypothetical protein